MEPEATSTPAVTETAPLPDGWVTAVSPVDGRAYFYNASTDATTWTHPSAPGADIVDTPLVEGIQIVPSLGDYSGIIANRSTMDFGESRNKSTEDNDIEQGGVYTKMTEYDPKQPINCHRCYSIFALILFFPLGMIAFCKSLSTVSNWKQERYEKAHNCSQAVLLFSRISCIIGIGFWSYFAYCLFAGPGKYVMEVPPEWIPDWFPDYNQAD